MKVTFSKVTDTKYMQIYLTEEEFERQETKEVIEKYKQEKYNIAIFIAGKENYPEILKRIVVKQVEVSHYVC